MKKIRLLRIVLVLLLLWYTMYLGYSFWLNAQPADATETTPKWQYVNLLQFATYFVLVIPAVVLVIGALNKFIKSGYFNLSSAKLLRAAGILLIINAIAMQVAHTIAFGYLLNIFTIIAYILNALLPLSFGIGLWAASDYIRRSVAVEKENQLTI